MRQLQAMETIRKEEQAWREEWKREEQRLDDAIENCKKEKRRKDEERQRDNGERRTAHRHNNPHTKSGRTPNSNRARRRNTEGTVENKVRGEKQH